MKIDKTINLLELVNVSTDTDSALSIKGAINSEKLLEDFDNSSKPMRLQIGVDEAGRGPLLGSVVVGGVILPEAYSGELEGMNLQNTPLSKLNDSKKISEKKRNQLYEILPSVALGYVSVDVPAKAIDEINILQASLLGMRVAVNELLNQISKMMDNKKLNDIVVELLFDGNKQPVLDFDEYQKWNFNVSQIRAEAVVKGDAKFASIAAASVFAKVERDQQMYDMADRYPDYGIDKHKGYPTKAHFEALENHGVLDEHRRSFAPVKKALAELE